MKLWFHDYFQVDASVYHSFLERGFQLCVLTLPSRQYIKLNKEVFSLFKYVIPWDTFSFPHIDRSLSSLDDLTYDDFKFGLNDPHGLYFGLAYDPVVIHQSERSYYGDKCYLDKTFHNALLSVRWNKLLEISGSDMFISANIPHLADDTILFKTIQSSQIPILRCHMHWSFSTSFWATLDGKLQINSSINNSAFKKELSSTCQHFKDTGIFFNPTRVKKESIRHYMFDRRAANTSFSVPPTFTQAAYRDLPICDKRITIFLHSEPEARQNPGGLPILDQKLLILLLSKRFPDSQIVVKEHPDMFDPSFNAFPYNKDNKYQYLREGLIKLSQACPNVYIADYSFDTTELINSSVLTCSFTGSVVVESLLNGVPCFSSGDFFFEIFPGVIRNISQLSWSEIENSRVKLTYETTETILNRLELCMFPGLLRSDHHFKYTSQEHSELSLLSAKSIIYLLSSILNSG